MKIVLIMFIFLSSIFAEDLNSTTNEETQTNPDVILEEWEFKEIEPFMTQKEMNIAVLISKEKFFKYIPQIMNSINSYLIKKDITYAIKLIDFSKDSNLTEVLDSATQEYNYIFTYFTEVDNIEKLKDYPYNFFFIPTINKNDTNITDSNIFFGGIDYDKQIYKLNELVDSFTNIYNSNTLSISKSLYDKEIEIINFPYQNLYFEKFSYKDTKIKDSNVILNTNAVMSAQILSNLVFYNNQPKQVLSTQINYNPLIFTLTQKESIENMIIANSISKSDEIINDNNLLLGSNIKYNWLNFSSSILMNKAYSLENDYNTFYANDFYLYMYNNQINYKTELYKIEKNGFKKIKEPK